VPLHILYIVNTFGPVGGMEKYVFETARSMAGRSQRVTVLCRQSHVSCGRSIQVLFTSPATSTRGWRDRRIFCRSVTEVLTHKIDRTNYDIIHSHENTFGQHVSTEHGPCTARGIRKAPLKFLDPSALSNLLLERRKLHAPSLKAMAFCSARVQKIALDEYPTLRAKINAVITPAYSYLAPASHATRRPGGGKVLGFIGKDWKRKGLPRALEIFADLKRSGSDWSMVVAGCRPEKMSADMTARFGYDIEFLGNVEAVDFFRRIDVLVHPAKDEPFGMVVAESLACGVPVVVSDQCGCVDHLTSGGLQVLSLRDPTPHWSAACRAAASTTAFQQRHRTWDDVAADHEKLYEKILSSGASRRP
jgi:UDP-glucose:(heptosyl)LPS alpha-1,3-glucosyltransferase